VKIILIADDEGALLEVLASVITELGHRPVVAHDGRQALSLARAHRPDLIISDHMMPGLTGVELLRTLRQDEVLGRVPFLLMSAAQPKGAEEADAFLAKPMSLEGMEAAITEALHRSAGALEERSEFDLIPPASHDSSQGMARAELLAWVAHEVKTPLSSARLNMDLLARDLVGPEHDTRRRRVRSALNQLERMGELVNSVLQASQIANGKLRLDREPTDLKALLEATVAYWRDTRPEAEFLLSVPEEDVQLSLDPKRVREVLDNLISNAVKYRHDSKEVEVRLVLSPGRAVISVQDFGVGIDAAELPRVFNRFHRAEGTHGEGHGLGLFIAAGLAALHGGALTAKSERGVGSTFSLALPLAD
jgi:signal transduction histidine kinase